MDLLAFHETYYFREVEQRGSLPATVAYAQELRADTAFGPTLSSPARYPVTGPEIHPGWLGS
jgi:hypothetical protein